MIDNLEIRLVTRAESLVYDVQRFLEALRRRKEDGQVMERILRRARRARRGR